MLFLWTFCIARAWLLASLACFRNPARLAGDGESRNAQHPPTVISHNCHYDHHLAGSLVVGDNFGFESGVPFSNQNQPLHIDNHRTPC